MTERVEMRGTKSVYDCATDKWNSEPVRLLVETVSGGRHPCLPTARQWTSCSNASSRKCSKKARTRLSARGEAMTQMVAEDYSQQFNKLAASKGLPQRLGFVPVSVVDIPASQRGEPDETCSFEPYLPGEYVKYNDNDGHAEVEDETASAFCFFTYHVSGGALVITDIQGVGSFYTDPQIHTIDGEGFGAGNLGERGIERYLLMHRHSLLCEQLGLPNPDASLTDEQLAAKIAKDEERIAREAMGEEGAYTERESPVANGQRQQQQQQQQQQDEDDEDEDLQLALALSRQANV